MIRFALAIAASALLASTVHAQPVRYEKDEQVQRAAVEAWTACIADEFGEDVREVLTLDYRTDRYAALLKDLAGRRVSSACFYAMPRRYRRIELGGLPFAGGLAEQAMESAPGEPLLMRLSRAAIGAEAPTYSYTDKVANCAVRGAPHLAANLFDSAIGSVEETDAMAQLAPVFDVCTRDGSAIDASPLALRSMLATASYRILAAQDSAEAQNRPTEAAE